MRNKNDYKPLKRDTIDQHVLYVTEPRILDDSSSDQMLSKLRSKLPLSNKIDEIPQSYGIPSEVFMKKTSCSNISEVTNAILLSSKFDNLKGVKYLKALPPSHIHRMQVSSNWIGDFYSSDLVVNVLNYIGYPLKNGDKFYDYGCSSGSLLRILAWAYPHVIFYGTDPVDTSIEWARQNLQFENVVFEHQGQDAPIKSLDDNSMDYVSAISIFSHHGYNAFRSWMDEMYRILKKNGILVFTTHGEGSIIHYSDLNLKPGPRYPRLAYHLIENGFSFEEVWLGNDDAGNIATDAEWGNSYYTKKRITEMLGDKFEILYFGSRTNQNNQDVYAVKKC